MATQKFKIYNTSDVIHVIKKRSCYHVFVDDKKPWIITSGISNVVTIYDDSKYQKPYTQMVIELSPCDLEIIRNIEDKIEKTMENELSGKTIENVCLTEKGIESIFCKTSDNTMKVNVSPDWCDFFDMQKNKVPFESISMFSTFKFVLEPTFCWFMNSRLGIHWKTVQIKHQEQEQKPFSLIDLMDDDDDDLGC